MNPLLRALDALLDATILFSFSNIGYRLRHPFWGAHFAPDLLRGKTVLITGASGGLGYAAALGLARLGAHLHLLARNSQKTARAREQIHRESGNPHIYSELVDLSCRAEVHAFCDRFLAQNERLDVLIHNAGVLLPKRQATPNGRETTFAVNLLAGHILTGRLEPALHAAAPARVLFVASGGMYSQRLEPGRLLEPPEPYNGALVYAQTKRAQVVLSDLWAQRLAHSGIMVNALHPGWVDTPGLAHSLPGFYRRLRPLLRTPRQGADTLIWLAAAPELTAESGGFWFDRARRPRHYLPGTRHHPAAAQALWALCEEQRG